MANHNYILNKVEHFSDADRDNLFRSPTLISGGGLMLCTSAGCNVLINAKSYSVGMWDLIVVSPFSIIQVIDIDPDFDCVIVGAALDFFSRIDVPNKGELFIEITNHPSISLTKAEAQEIISLRDMLIREEQDSGKPFFEEVRNSILLIIIFKVFALYTNREPNREQRQSRNGEILNSFIVDLLKHNYQERKLDFYAQKQLIT
ncbi:MAG: hypothetical protein SNG10_06880, partial [Rikenellaceae bacterium]